MKQTTIEKGFHILFVGGSVVFLVSLIILALGIKKVLIGLGISLGSVVVLFILAYAFGKTYETIERKLEEMGEE